MTQNNVKEIAALLNRAGGAHYEYEQTVFKGICDRDWVIWYAVTTALVLEPTAENYLSDSNKPCIRSAPKLMQW